MAPARIERTVVPTARIPPTTAIQRAFLIVLTRTLPHIVGRAEAAYWQMLRQVCPQRSGIGAFTGLQPLPPSGSEQSYDPLPGAGDAHEGGWHCGGTTQEPRASE